MPAPSPEKQERTATIQPPEEPESIRQLSEHLIQNWSLLVAMSRRLAGTVIDPDDLLSSALLTTFSQCQRAPDTIQHFNAYIISSMRNRVKDELKSPRSRVGSLTNEDGLLAPPHPAIDRVELASELSLLRKAFSQLPEDQRTVLGAMFYRDQSASQLTEELQRSRPAVSMLAKRAKHNLKRTMLKLLLEKEAPSKECRRAANGLPLSVGERPPTGSEGEGSHWVDCTRCRSIWVQFGTFGAASIGALLVLGETLGGGIRPAAAAALTFAPEPSVSAQADLRETKWRSLSFLLALTGVASVAALVWVLPHQFSSEKSYLEVARKIVDGEGVNYRVHFDSEALGWQVRSLEIDSTVTVESVKAPEGWECAVEAGNVTCATDSRMPRSVEFLVFYENGLFPGYTLKLQATTSSGSEIVGTAIDERERASDE